MIRRRVHQREVAVDGVAVRVRWSDFLPPAGADADAAIVVIPGWSLAVTSRACWPLYQAFADRSQRRAIAMDTRATPMVGDSLFQQAAALARVVRERGLRRVVIAGHSQGGALATNLAAHLMHQASDLTVEGVILLDPVGLYDQAPAHLAVAFVVDALVHTPVALLRFRPSGPGKLRTIYLALRVAADLLGGIGADMASSPSIRGYRHRFAAEVAGMAQFNPRLGTLRCPVVLVQGIDDRVSDPRRLALGGGNASRDLSWLFRASPRVCYLVPTKLGLHSLPLLRPTAIASATLGALRR